MSAAEVIYGVDCPLPPALGAARLVAWYNVTPARPWRRCACSTCD